MTLDEGRIYLPHVRILRGSKRLQFCIIFRDICGVRCRGMMPKIIKLCAKESIAAHSESGAVFVNAGLQVVQFCCATSVTIRC